MKNSIVDDINSQIKKHGSNDYGEPIFRVVFSDEQVENRWGTYNEYSGDIFLRSFTGIKEVKKYPWIKSKWILERWVSCELAAHPDLHNDKNGLYICVYVFQDANNNYLPPLLKVSEIVIYNLLHPRSYSEILSQDIEIEVNKDEAEINKMEEDFKIESDISATKDQNSQRETSSVGYVKDKI